MKTRGLFSTMRRMRIVVVFLALLLAYGAISYSPQAAPPNNFYAFELGGITGATNNTTLAYGRFILVAPFWPSKGLAENGDIDLSQLNNDSLYVIDIKKPDTPVLSTRLTSRDSTVCFPSKVVFDPTSKNVYVRGTRYQETDGVVTWIEAIAYVRLNLDDNGKPVFDSNVVTFDIPGVAAEYTSDAPLDLALNGKGDALVFTNGGTIYSYNIALGYLNKVDIVEPSQYGTDDSISFLGVDPATNIVSVCENRKFVSSVGKDEVVKISSEISFYRLDEFGKFEPLKRIEPDQFGDGTALCDGSNIAIVSDSDSAFALFATNDGWLCTVDLGDDGLPATVKRLHSFPDLALTSITGPNPLLIQYDSVNRVIGIEKAGFTAQISRPLNGKPGRISRPLNLHVTSESPVLAMAKLNKKNKVGSANSFTQEFTDEGGLSNFVIGEDSKWLISTYSGNLFAVEITGDLRDAQPQLIGEIGSRVDRIDYYSDRTSVVSISAFTLDDGGIRIASPGSLAFGKISDLQSQSRSVVQALLPTASLLGRSTPAIRRPCNIRR